MDLCLDEKISVTKEPEVLDEYSDLCYVSEEDADLVKN